MKKLYLISALFAASAFSFSISAISFATVTSSVPSITANSPKLILLFFSYRFIYIYQIIIS